MGTAKSLLPKSLKKSNWEKLSPWEKEQVATYLVVGILYPPPPDSSKKKLATQTFAKNRRRRRRAARVLLAHEFGTRLDDAVSTLIDGTEHNHPERLFQLFKPIIPLWRKGWIAALQRGGSLSRYNKQRPRRLWSELANIYLVAVALVRQRNEHAKQPSSVKDVGLRRAIWLVTETYPDKCQYACKRTKLESVVGDMRTIWPLVCGLLYCFGRSLGITGDGTNASLHELLPPTPPLTQELINCFHDAPDVVLSAARYFEEELCRRSGLPEQLKPPLVADDCTALPNFTDLEAEFSVPPTLAALSQHEIRLAQKYSASKYKGKTQAKTESQRGMT